MRDLEAQRARRDRIALRLFLGTLVLVLSVYFTADALGWIPARCSFRAYRGRGDGSISERYETFDPDLTLGIAIGETRYRFNYVTHHAIVTRPLFGVTRWRIPETVVYDGETFTVTALDTFAFLNATTVTSAELPATLQYLNNSAQFAGERMAAITLHRPDGTSDTFFPPFDTLILPGDLEAPEEGSN